MSAKGLHDDEVHPGLGQNVDEPRQAGPKVVDGGEHGGLAGDAAEFEAAVFVAAVEQTTANPVELAVRSADSSVPGQLE